MSGFYPLFEMGCEQGCGVTVVAAFYLGLSCSHFGILADEFIFFINQIEKAAFDSTGRRRNGAKGLVMGRMNLG